jgi:MarR family transcriptional regulator, organic hydroperoxide resistance regulator
MNESSLHKDALHSYVHERIAHLTRLAARSFARALQIRLAEYDITFGQWVFLRILWAEDGLSQRRLSEAANLTEPTTHAALQKLEQLGLIERRNLPGNRRRQHAFLTDAGRALRAHLEPLAIEVNDVALEGISPEDQNVLRSVLMRVIANLAEDERHAVAEGRGVPPTRLR